MGYTHYWRRKPELDPTRFSAAVKDAEKLVEHLRKKEGYALQESHDLAAPAVFADDRVAFNGVEGERYEDFEVPLVYREKFIPPDPDGRLFAFCKTAHRPYNSAVIACLIVFNHHFGKAFGVSSDGAERGGMAADWRGVAAACQEVLGYGGDFKLGEE